MKIHKIGVTGHRKLLDNPAIIYEKTKQLFQNIKSQHETAEVNTGMALGFDQLVCLVCLELEIPYVAAVPCDGQDALWKEPQREVYADLLSKASRVVVVNPGAYEAWKMHARNRWIVDNSDEMIVHWNGFYDGGTGGCMKLIKSQKIPWHNTNSKYQQR